MKRLFAILAVVVVLTGCGKNKDEFASLEKNLKKDASTYYEENVIGTVYPPFSCQNITLNDMKEAGMSVNEYINKGCDADKSSAVVVVTDYSDPENIKYEVVSNLSCDGYISEVSEDLKTKYQCLSVYINE